MVIPPSYHAHWASAQYPSLFLSTKLYVWFFVLFGFFLPGKRCDVSDRWCYSQEPITVYILNFSSADVDSGVCLYLFVSKLTIISLDLLKLSSKLFFALFSGTADFLLIWTSTAVWNIQYCKLHNGVFSMLGDCAHESLIFSSKIWYTSPEC